MQKFTQKYTIVTLLENKKEGYEYTSSSWPLHITIADTFSVELDINILIEKLVRLAETLQPVKAIASHDKNFGPQQQIQVTILDMSGELVALHYSVVELLKEAGVKFNDPQYAETGFRAHSVVQPHARININDTVTLNNLAVIDMFPNNNPYQRKILKVIKFSK